MMPKAPLKDNYPIHENDTGLDRSTIPKECFSASGGQVAAIKSPDQQVKDDHIISTYQFNP